MIMKMIDTFYHIYKYWWKMHCIFICSKKVFRQFKKRTKYSKNFYDDKITNYLIMNIVFITNIHMKYINSSLFECYTNLQSLWYNMKKKWYDEIMSIWCKSNRAYFFFTEIDIIQHTISVQFSLKPYLVATHFKDGIHVYLVWYNYQLNLHCRNTEYA